MNPAGKQKYGCLCQLLTFQLLNLQLKATPNSCSTYLSFSVTGSVDQRNGTKIKARKIDSEHKMSLLTLGRKEPLDVGITDEVLP